jgi:hypothetical protein
MTTAFLPPDLYLGETIEEQAKNSVGYFKAREFYAKKPDATMAECMKFLEKEGF